MKYIRTKDGKIYELQETKSGEKYLVRTNELIPLWNTNAYEIFNQSDTIEELCDYFAFEDAFSDNSTIRFQPVLFTSHSFAKLQAKNQNRPIIAYIVIEKKGVKTLEPVAKMNEKGELELL